MVGGVLEFTDSIHYVDRKQGERVGGMTHSKSNQDNISKWGPQVYHVLLCCATVAKSHASTHTVGLHQHVLKGQVFVQSFSYLVSKMNKQSEAQRTGSTVTELT